MERDRRGMAPKITVQSQKSKLPRDFKIFLTNGENKTRMIELIHDVLVSNREAILRIKAVNVLYILPFKMHHGYKGNCASDPRFSQYIGGGRHNSTSTCEPSLRKK